MKELILYLEQGRTIIIRNLKELWIEYSYAWGCWHLCFRDSEYEQYVIYGSYDLKLLREKKNKIMKAYEEGNKSIRV